MLPRLTALSFAIRADSFSSTPKQILILSCARRFLFLGTKNQRKVASARPIFIAKLKGNAQIILLKSLKNVYEIIKTTPKNKIKRDLQISKKKFILRRISKLPAPYLPCCKYFRAKFWQYREPQGFSVHFSL